MVASKQSNQAKNTDPKEDKIELWPIEKVLPYPKNQKKHPDDQVEKIANSIREFGFNQPIVIEPDGTILAGHGRRLAAMKLGLTKVPVTIKKLTPPQAKAYRIADNKTNESDWDFGMLKDDFASLKELEFDLTLTGFDQSEIDGLLMPEILEGKTDPDFVPTMPKECDVKPGDLFILGQHRLVCGDATSQTSVDLLMKGDMADLVLTDPPYNVAVNDESEESLKTRNRRKDGLKIQNDHMSEEDFREFLMQTFHSYFTALREGGAIYVFYADSMTIPFMTTFIEAGFHFAQNCIWKKQQFVMTRKDYHYKHEPILYGWKKGTGHDWETDRKQSSVWEFDRPFKNELHPTMKPINMLEYAVKNSSKVGGKVLDLFGGSGSTMIACEKTQRKCFMMELDPKYCFVILRRWAEFTGEDPMRVDPDTGESTPWYP